MRAFSFIAEHINVSIYFDTITIYAKSRTARHLNLSAKLWKNYNPHMIFSRDADHARYHSDDFDRKIKHYHAQFTKPIAATDLAAIAADCMRLQILSATERDNLLAAYSIATPTPVTHQFNFFVTHVIPTQEGTPVTSSDLVQWV